MSNFNIDYLVIAGGGGGNNYGGGGGAGGYRTSYGTGNISGGNSPVETALSMSFNTAYPVTVGAGSVGTPGGSANAGANYGGDDSAFTSITSTGGGGGGASVTYPPGNGGSGGGEGFWDSANNITYYGTGISGQGFRGGRGDGNNDPTWGMGGGGGAGQVGQRAASGGTPAGDGGDGLASSITGISVMRAGGGAGGAWENRTGGTGGSGGGGNGGRYTVTSGAANTGGGGGGTGSAGQSQSATAIGGSGGSGIVILRYVTADANYTATGLTPTETIDGTDTILSFTTVGTGSITFTVPPPPPFNGTSISNELLDLNQQNNEIGLRIPVGDDANQPTPDVSNTGSIRYNTDRQKLSISDGTEFEVVDSSQSTLPTVTLTNSWRAWDTASFVNGGTSCTDVTSGLVLGPYSSGSPGAFFYGSFNNVAGNKYWVLNGGGSHGRRAGFTRPTEFTISYWGNKPSNPGYNSERAIWSFNIFGGDNVRLARRNNAGTSSLRIYSGNSSIATFADGITTSTWYNITLTFSSNTVKTYVGVQGSTNTTLINTTTLSSGNFPTGISNDSNGTGFWIGTNSGYTDWSTDNWSSLSIYDGVARQAEIDTIVSNGYQQ